MRFLFWLALVILVVCRFWLTKPAYKVGQKIRLRGKVLQEPFHYTNRQSFSLMGLKISLPLYPEIHYGDEIKIRGMVENGGLKNPVLEEVRETAGGVFRLRNSMVKFYQQTLPEPHAALIAGITLGAKSSLPADFWTALKKTGTAHIVVASGMNVSLVAGFLLAILILFISRRWAVVLAVSGIWFYAFLVGLEAPVVRAAIMLSVAFLAQLLGRLNSAWTALFLAAIIMLLVKPGWLTDLGFSLSFVATGSLMLFQKRLMNRLSFLPNFVREDFSTSLAAQIGVIPILFVTFGYFNILSPLINLLVLWTVAPLTIIGAFGGVLGLIFPFLGRLVLFLGYPLSWWFIWIVKLFA